METVSSYLEVSLVVVCFCILSRNASLQLEPIFVIFLLGKLYFHSKQNQWDALVSKSLYLKLSLSNCDGFHQKKNPFSLSYRPRDRTLPRPRPLLFTTAPALQVSSPTLLWIHS